MSHKPTPAALVGVIALAAVALQALLVTWFAWPAQRIEPRDLPVVVAGPAPAAGAFAQRLGAERPGAFAVTQVDDAATADARLRDRAAYAAFVLQADGVSLHLASAASPTVATLLTQAAQQLGGGRPVPVVDVVASPPDDPRGAAFASGFLPLLLTSLAAGLLVVLLAAGRMTRLAGVIGYAVAAGLVAAAVLHAMGVLTGPYLADAGAVGLLALAVSAAVAGLTAAIGRAGAVLGVLVVFFLANPISGITSAPELLPRPWGAVGQLLPPGAGATLLRSVAFFDGAGSARPLAVLAAWAAVGILLLAVGRWSARVRTDTVDERRTGEVGAGVGEG